MHPTESLDDEITTLRTNIRLVADSLALADDPTRHAHALARLSDSLIKALRAQHALAPNPHDELQSAIDRYFEEHGLDYIDTDSPANNYGQRYARRHSNNARHLDNAPESSGSRRTQLSLCTPPCQIGAKSTTNAVPSLHVNSSNRSPSTRRERIS